MFSPSSRVTIASAACACTLGAALSAQTLPLPLVVERSSVAQESRVAGRGAAVLAMELVNSGAKTVSAWAYWIELRLDDGTTRRVPHTTDALPATEPDKYVVLAHGRRIETQRLPDVSPATVTDVTVQMAAVIFDDATAAGDERLLTSLFARRVQHRETWNALATILGVARAQHAEAAMVLEKISADLAAATSVAPPSANGTTWCSSRNPRSAQRPAAATNAHRPSSRRQTSLFTAAGT